MKILFVYKEDYPWDVRVEKIVDALIADGHRVSLVARNLANRHPQEQMDDLQVIRLPRVAGRLRAAANVPAFVNPVWLVTLASALRTTKPDVVFVRDIPLVPVVVSLAKLHDCRVVLDMAECYPELYRTLIGLSDHPRLLALGKSPWSAQLLESFSVDRCAHTFTVVEEARERLIDRGHDPARISVVSNTPRRIEAIAVRKHAAERELRLAYVGFLERIRGLDLALHGLSEFVRVHPAVKVGFDIVGSGPARRELEQLTTKLGLEARVRFHGWLPPHRAREVLEKASVGLIPHLICEAWHRTVPNKLFDYMACGIPVLSTANRPVVRIVEAEGCGRIFVTPASFAAALGELADSALRQQLGALGRAAVEREYHWKRDERKLLEVVRTLAD